MNNIMIFEGPMMDYVIGHMTPQAKDNWGTNDILLRYSAVLDHVSRLRASWI